MSRVEVSRRAFCNGLGLATMLASPKPIAAAIPKAARDDDEAYWAEIRAAFPARSGAANLLHTGGGSSPQFALDELKRLIQIAAQGGEDEEAALSKLKESGSSELIRATMAEAFGCDADEIALTRNAMEGLAIGLLGVDLRAGDEVLTTRLDYDSCIEILRQRERRDGVTLKLIEAPAPDSTTAQAVAAFQSAITERTRLLLLCHMHNKNGQILPIKEICEMARKRGVVTVVDGAQSASHIDFAIRDLGCDFFASSLHKWFYAPRGTGFFYVRKDMIDRVWPIWANWSGKPPGSIEKFEDVGTVMKAVPATLPLLARFNAAIGAKRKEQRLRHLRNLWLAPLSNLDRVTLLTDPNPDRSCGIGAFRVEGIDSAALAKRLRQDHNIVIGSISLTYAPALKGNYVATDLSNSPDEIARFVDITARLLRT